MSLNVRDLMTEEVVTVTVDTDLARVYDLMTSREIRHLPIVDYEGDLQGLVTHRDLVGRAADRDEPLAQWRAALRQRKVHEVMSRSVETTEPEQSLSSAASLMLEQKFGCLPVVEGRRVVGILTESDFVRYVAEGR